MKAARTNAHLTAAAAFFLPLLLASHYLSFAQQPSTQKQEIYNLLAAHRFQQAEQAAAAYLAETPGDCSVNVLLGLALRGEAKLEPAFKAFRAAMNQCPQNLAALEGAAETAFLLNNTEAKELVTQVIKLRPADETAHAMLVQLKHARATVPARSRTMPKPLRASMEVLPHCDSMEGA